MGTFPWQDKYVRGKTFLGPLMGLEGGSFIGAIVSVVKNISLSNRWENDKPEKHCDMSYLSGRFTSIAGFFFS